MMLPISQVRIHSDRFHPIADLFPMDGEQLAALVDDIRANGLRDPIVEFEGLILDGRNRYEACYQSECEPRFQPFEGDDPIAFVLSKNLHRRHLNESQRAMIMARMATLRPGWPPTNPPRGGVQAEVAKALNIGVRTGQRAKVVLERGVPELVRRVERGEIPVKIAAEVAKLEPDIQQVPCGQPEGKLRGAVKAVARAQREQQLAARTVEVAQTLISALYLVIYADPPWRFEPYSRETGMDRAAGNHYPTLDVDGICKIKPPAAKDCVLFLWATAPMLREAMCVIDAWGFTYKSNIIWGKDRAGTGYWTRSRHELLLIATKGSVPAPAPDEQSESLILAAVGRHSEKPDIFAQMIEQMFPSCRPLEMFARKTRNCWDAWGNEITAESTQLPSDASL
jgi:N6-adenosine-specific RNA methylase IME4